MPGLRRMIAMAAVVTCAVGPACASFGATPTPPGLDGGPDGALGDAGSGRESAPNCAPAPGVGPAALVGEAGAPELWCGVERVRLDINPRHCGECGRACGGQIACEGGGCVPEAVGAYGGVGHIVLQAQ